MTTPTMRFRLANENDIGFIFNSWLKSFRNTPFALNISNPVYFSEHHKLIEKLLKVSAIAVACNENDSTQIYGWACASTIDDIPCLHYVYVKHSFRNLGIGTALLYYFNKERKTMLYTHYTKNIHSFKNKCELVYHPYILINEYIKPEEQV